MAGGEVFCVAVRDCAEVGEGEPVGAGTGVSPVPRADLEAVAVVLGRLLWVPSGTFADELLVI